jgi:hypothetical protein
MVRKSLLRYRATVAVFIRFFNIFDAEYNAFCCEWAIDQYRRIRYWSIPEDGTEWLLCQDLYQFSYRKFHFRYRLSESYHFRYRFLPLSLQGPIVTGIRIMERSYLCTYTMNVPTLRTFTRACSLLKTFSSSKLPSEALQFLPTIVTGNRYRDTHCYRKSLQEIVTETHIVTGNRYRKSLQRHT